MRASISGELLTTTLVNILKELIITKTDNSVRRAKFFQLRPSEMIIRGVEREDQTLLRVQYSRNLIFRNVLNFSEKSVLTAHMTKYYLPILLLSNIRNIFLQAPHLSHCLRVQLAMIQRETMKTRRTVPGQMVMRVLRTNLVLKLILLRAPILLELASVKSLLWSNMTRQIKYNLEERD